MNHPWKSPSGPSDFSQDYTLPSGLAPQVLFKGLEAHVTLRAAPTAGAHFLFFGDVFVGGNHGPNMFFFFNFFWDMSSVIFWTSDSKICVLLVWILENTSENERFDLQQWRLKFEVTKMESGIEARQLGLKQHIDYWPIVNCMNKIGSKPTCFRCLPIIHPQIRQFVQDLPSFIC